MMSDDVRQPEVTQCPKCGEAFECSGGSGCWCAQLPHVLPCSRCSDATCFCPSCLKEAIDLCEKDPA